ncbi:MAG: hypothetical protein HYZ20_07555 [Burkholderiales bacterium]|nr:hypothetical protein [Burkholderiales bacterium]
MAGWRARLLLLLLAAAVGGVAAVPLVPRGDDDVVERLPAATAGRRAEERALRRQLEARPDDARPALAAARRLLEAARADGDPRLAGQALALLARWDDDAQAPPDVVVMQATLRQHLHEFDAAAELLERLLARAPRHAQAWLTLATIRRVQGRYDASDAACRGVAAGGANLYAAACLAENDGLRGATDAARATLRRLAATPGLDDSTRGWLLASVAELEARDGRGAAAERAWRDALRADPSPAARLGFADFLIAAGRGSEAAELLDGLARSDAILLRLAVAQAGMRTPRAEALARELAGRESAAGERPGQGAAHARERATAALFVARDARRALDLARTNLRQQREPVDLLLFAQAARAAGDAAALREAAALRREIGLHDRRLDALR